MSNKPKSKTKSAEKDREPSREREPSSAISTKRWKKPSRHPIPLR